MSQQYYDQGGYQHEGTSYDQQGGYQHEGAPYDQQGYYDETGQWHYYEAAPTQPLLNNNQYAENQQYNYQESYHQYNDAHNVQNTQSNSNWAQANSYPQTLPSSTDSKKKPAINPRQIPRHIRWANLEDGTVPEPVLTEYFTSSDSHPPSPLDDFKVIDDGNASPRYMRLTSYQIPASNDLVESTRLSIGAIITPLCMPGPGESPVPVVDMGEGGPIRCSRCHAYLNAFSSFTEDGQNFICNFCDMTTSLPHWYVCNVDGNGIRRDRYERPELHLGSVEFIAPPSYSTRPAQEPCFMFVIDVSFAAITSGLLNTTIKSVQSCIAVMAEYPRVRIGIISYSNAVHVYSLKKGAAEPSVMVIASSDDVFVPVPADMILVHPNDHLQRQMLDNLLLKLPGLHEPQRSNCTAFGAAIHVAVEGMSSCGGKLIIVQSSLPKVTLGALDDRDVASVYATEKEKELFTPQDSFYQLQATTCAERCISVDLFVSASAYVDIATVGVLSTVTGGQIFFYPDFHSGKDGYSLECDMMQSLTRETGFEGIMAVRTSTGIRVADYFGNFFRRDPAEIELPAIDCDKSFAIRLEHENSLPDKSPVCIQAALLYTAFNGERRIRVHTIRVLSTTSLANIYRHADLYSVVNISIRQAAMQCCEQGVATTRSFLRQAVIDVLYTYRKECAAVSSSGQLILPESLKLLPLYTLGLQKSAVLHDCIRADQRVNAFIAIQSMPISQALTFCLPTLYALHRLPSSTICLAVEDPTVSPMALPEYELVSRDFIEDFGIYLLDNGFICYIYVGPNADPQLVFDLFGVEDVSLYEPHDLFVYPNEDPCSLATRVSNLLDRIRTGRCCYCPVRVVHERSQYLTEFNENLIEGTFRPPAGSKMSGTDPELMSYVEFLCHVHRQIQDRFT